MASINILGQEERVPVLETIYQSMKISIVMIEFEATYFEEFLSHLAVKDLLVSSLCAVELRSKGYTSKFLITQAVDKLEKFLSNPDYSQLSILMEVSSRILQKLSIQ
jgi:predicted nucleic acid-binding protein